MNIEWNKVTWYSKLLAVVLFVLTFYIGIVLGVNWGKITSTNTPPKSVANNAASLPNIYENKTDGFSIQYPDGFTMDNAYTYSELGPGKDINGVKFTIPATLTVSTNLNPDSYLSVEEIPQVKNCAADIFLGQGAAHSLTDGNTAYSFATFTGAAAGNRYEEDVYAIPGTNPCLAIRYFIHYGNIDNYPPTIKQFDEPALLKQFDAIRHTLVISH